MLVYQRVKLCPAKSGGLETNKNMTNNSGWWYTYPSEKWWSSSVGIIQNSQYDGKVIQNSMVPVTTNQNFSMRKIMKSKISRDISRFIPKYPLFFSFNLQPGLRSSSRARAQMAPNSNRNASWGEGFVAWFTWQTDSLRTGKSTF